MPRFTPLELRILEALEVYESAGDVARETGAPLHQVLHLQRLYGSAECQADRRRADAQSEFQVTITTARRVGQLHTDREKLNGRYGSYWRELLAPPPAHHARQARLVPDDRADEDLSFDGILGALTAAFTKEASA